MASIPLIAPDYAVFMKVGYHGVESWKAIIQRKMDEERRHGFCYWGYGGSVCHPLRQVQPFADGQSVMFVGLPTESRFVSGAISSGMVSTDGVVWTPVPTGVSISASRYALCLAGLAANEALVDVGAYQVAIGAKAGATVSSYMRFRCDKACAVRRDGGSVDKRRVALVATVVAPYAVLVG